MEVANVIDLPDTKAHNMTADFDLGNLYVTHSGPGADGNLNTNMSVIDIAGEAPSFSRSVTTGTNPLGIALIQR